MQIAAPALSWPLVSARQPDGPPSRNSGAARPFDIGSPQDPASRPARGAGSPSRPEAAFAALLAPRDAAGQSGAPPVQPAAPAGGQSLGDAPADLRRRIDSNGDGSLSMPELTAYLDRALPQAPPGRPIALGADPPPGRR